MDTSVAKSLYPSTLFHFTNKKSFNKILFKFQFKLSYASERITYEKGKKNLERELAIPMVSFCDLRLSEIEAHANNYGTYGIGLSKDWANRNDLNPVFYVNKNSDFTRTFMEGLNNIYLNLLPKNNLTNVELNLLNMYRYMKNYENVLERRGKTRVNNYRFADEREWRFVPKVKTDGIEPFISKARFEEKGKNYFNRLIEIFNLQFELDDIKYLVIKEEKERENLIRNIKLSWEPHETRSSWDDSYTEKLISRILTIQQIKDDI
jgi:hypothetical protein